MGTEIMTPFNGLQMNLGNLASLSHAKTRSISAENPTGNKGQGGKSKKGTGFNAGKDLGQGWKISPSIVIESAQTCILADIEGSGAIQQIFMTLTGNWRFLILRMYWDGEETPSVEVPVGDFFACGWGKYAQVNSLPVSVNPRNAFNCFWVMPFKKSCKITLENLNSENITAYYQINYTLTNVSDDTAQFHAQFRRIKSLPLKKPYTILDGIRGWGHYVGTYICWGSNSNGWWGEGEIKFFLDGDTQFPTICGTGVEDYILGSYGFSVDEDYRVFSTPFSGMPQVIRQEGRGQSQQRFGLYRWHIMDPIRFEQDLKVTIQGLGWNAENRYLPLNDDIASVAYWYQQEPHLLFPEILKKDQLEINE